MSGINNIDNTFGGRTEKELEAMSNCIRKAVYKFFTGLSDEEVYDFVMAPYIEAENGVPQVS